MVLIRLIKQLFIPKYEYKARIVGFADFWGDSPNELEKYLNRESESGWQVIHIAIGETYFREGRGFYNDVKYVMKRKKTYKKLEL